MSEELEQEVEVNPIEQFIDAIRAGDFNSSEEHFQSIIGGKVETAIDAEKLSVAQTIYNEIDDSDLEDDEEEEMEEFFADDEEETEEDFVEEDDEEEITS